jgi:hypothetical protein
VPNPRREFLALGKRVAHACRVEFVICPSHALDDRFFVRDGRMRGRL